MYKRETLTEPDLVSWKSSGAIYSIVSFSYRIIENYQSLIHKLFYLLQWYMKYLLMNLCCAYLNKQKATLTKTVEN